MKKIFTLLFFAGIVSSATFAQNDRSRQAHSDYQSGDNRNQPSGYSRNNNRENSNGYSDNYGYGQTYQDHDHGWNKENKHGYGQEKNYDRSYGNRNDWRGFRNDYPGYDHDRRIRNHRYGWGHAWFRERSERNERW